MLIRATEEHRARLLLTFSDLCQTDEEIALCLNFMRFPALAGAITWTAKAAREAMPSAYSTVCSQSYFAGDGTNKTTDKYCESIYRTIKKEK